MLAEHRIYNANKGLIAVEQPVSSGEQITSNQPSHWCSLSIESSTSPAGARNSSFFTVWRPTDEWVTSKDRPKEIRERLIRTEDPEISLILIQFDHVTQVFAQHKRILTVNGSG